MPSPPSGVRRTLTSTVATGRTVFDAAAAFSGGPIDAAATRETRCDADTVARCCEGSTADKQSPAANATSIYTLCGTDSSELRFLPGNFTFYAGL